MISVKWKNENKLYKKLEYIVGNLEKNSELSIKQSMQMLQELAFKYKAGKKDISMISFEIKGLKGRLYTDKKTFAYAMFLEFGTGTFAELPHIGKTKTFLESGFEYWFLPVEKAERDFGKDRIITIKGKQFYIMYAQQPKPFMRPAAFQGRDVVLDIFQDNIFNLLKEAVK